MTNETDTASVRMAFTAAATAGLGTEPPPGGMRTFVHVLANTMIANITTGFLWFALTFWVYLETRSVLATGIIGGAYMLMIAVFAISFGTIVDRHRKIRVMRFSSAITLASFLVAGALYLARPESDLADLGGPWFWLFLGVILFGSVVAHMRNIALSTTVTLLVPVERHANANGMVGIVQGLAFIMTSVFSGLSIGLLGLGWTLAIAVALTLVALAHLLFMRVHEAQPRTAEGRAPVIDLAGSLAAIRSAPGLFALILFSTMNNLISGVYIALMDPYGLTLFSVEAWGIVFAVASTGFVIGGIVIAKFGLGRNPIRAMLLVVAAMGILGAFFTVREWWWLYALGTLVYMALIPAVEASEQTVIQRVVPFDRQGRVFGFAAAFESAAAPITAFLIAPIAEFLIIPYMTGAEGRATWSWLLGEGEARGIALVFLVSGLVLVAFALASFGTRSYSTLSERFLVAPTGRAANHAPDPAPSAAAADSDASDTTSSTL